MDYSEGFVGCIRALLVNGQLMDLRGKVERGEVTYGVSAGESTLNTGTGYRYWKQGQDIGTGHRDSTQGQDSGIGHRDSTQALVTVTGQRDRTQGLDTGTRHRHWSQ